MSHSARLAVAAVVLTVLQTGCSEDEPRPRMAPTPSASPTPTDPPTLDPTPAATPEVLTPEETVRAWVDAHNAALTTGEPSRVLALSSPSCKSCRDLLEPFVEVYRLGGQIETQGWMIEKVRRKPDFSNSKHVLAAIAFADGMTVKSEGAEPVYFAAEKHILQFALAQGDVGWAVDQIAFLS